MTKTTVLRHQDSEDHESDETIRKYAVERRGREVETKVSTRHLGISRGDMDRWGDYWRFTNLSIRRLFEEVFSPEHVRVESFGNVLAAMAVLHGMAAGELRPEELDYRDPDYEVTIGVRALKLETPSEQMAQASAPGECTAIPTDV